MKTLSEVKAEMLSAAKSKPVGGYAVFDRDGNVMAHAAMEFPHCYVDEEDLAWAKANGYRFEEEVINGRALTWVFAKPVENELFQSADGKYYLEANLPENDDSFVTEKYSEKVKAERTSRIADTDDYEKLSDITVQKSTRAKREALTDEEKAEVLAYRQSLRDFPQVEGFPFVEYPDIPECIAYECEQKIEQRENMRRGYEH